MTDERDIRAERDRVVTKAMTRLELAEQLITRARSEIGATVGREHTAAQRLVVLEVEARRVISHVLVTVVGPLRRAK